MRIRTRPFQSLRDAIAIALLCFAVYLLTASGHLYSPDEETMYQVAVSIATRGAVDIPVDRPLPLIALNQGSGGLWYAHFGILPSLLALPFFALGRIIGAGDSLSADLLAHLFVSLINIPVSALTAGVLAFWVRRLGYGRSVAWAVALIYACATPAWVYSRTFFSEPLTTLLLLLACERAYAYRQNEQCSAALLCGLWCGLLLATRVAAAVVVPWVVLYLVVGRRETRDARHETRDRSPTAYCLLPTVYCLLGFLPGLLLFAGYNLARGEPLWSTGYGSESWIFTTPLSVSLPGLLWQPARGLLFYALPVLLGLLGLWAFWRNHRATSLLIIACGVSYTLVHAGRAAWEGGAAWGPRYLLPLVPLLMLPAAALLTDRRPETGDRGGRQETGEERRETRHRGMRTAGRNASISRLASRVSRLPTAYCLLPAACCAVVGLIVTLLGLLVNFNTYPNAPEMRERGRLFGVQTAIAGHAWLLRDRWERYTLQPSCDLGNGLYGTEAPPKLLPRRTGASGEIVCRSDGPAAVSVLLDDRRPPNAPVGELMLLRNGSSVGALRAGEQRLYTLLLPPGRNALELRATTWNPKAIGFSERDDDLGVAIMDIQAWKIGGAPLPLVDTSIEPLPHDSVKRWAWYYQPTNIHLVDMWWWYLPRSEIGLRGAWVFGALLVLVSVAALVAAAALVFNIKVTRRSSNHPQMTQITQIEET